MLEFKISLETQKNSGGLEVHCLSVRCSQFTVSLRVFNLKNVKHFLCSAEMFFRFV